MLYLNVVLLGVGGLFVHRKITRLFFFPILTLRFPLSGPTAQAGTPRTMLDPGDGNSCLTFKKHVFEVSFWGSLRPNLLRRKRRSMKDVSFFPGRSVVQARALSRPHDARREAA